MLPVVDEADNRSVFRAGYLIVWCPFGRRLHRGEICLAAEPEASGSARFYEASSKCGRTSLMPTNCERSR